MATQTIPHRTSISNQACQAESLQAAFERLNSLSPAEMMKANIMVDVGDMQDPGPDFSPSAWNRGR